MAIQEQPLKHFRMILVVLEKQIYSMFYSKYFSKDWKSTDLEKLASHVNYCEHKGTSRIHTSIMYIDTMFFFKEDRRTLLIHTNIDEHTSEEKDCHEQQFCILNNKRYFPVLKKLYTVVEQLGIKSIKRVRALTTLIPCWNNSVTYSAFHDIKKSKQ